MSPQIVLQSYVPIIVLSVFALVAAGIDLWKLKIYNAFTIPLILSGLIYHVSIGFYFQAGGLPGPDPLQGFLSSFGGVLFGLGILMVPWLMGGMGAGDVKLMGAVGAWLGVVLTFWVFIVSALAAGICSLLMISYAKSFQDTWANLQIIWYRVAAFGQFLSSEDSLESQVGAKNRRSRLIPFGVMLFLGLGIVSLGILFDWLPKF